MNHRKNRQLTLTLGIFLCATAFPGDGQSGGHLAEAKVAQTPPQRAIAPPSPKDEKPVRYQCASTDKKVRVSYTISDKNGLPSLSITLNGATKTYPSEEIVSYDIGDGFEIRIRTQYEPELHSVFQTIHFPRGKTQFNSKLEEEYYHSSFASSELDPSRSKAFDITCAGETKLDSSDLKKLEKKSESTKN